MVTEPQERQFVDNLKHSSSVLISVNGELATDGGIYSLFLRDHSIDGRRHLIIG